MKIILLSGGSGTRLWPLSNDSRAKQFLKVLKNTEDKKLESMLQRVYRQLLCVVHRDDIIVACNKIQIDMIRNQLGDIPIVVEPERRDTFPAILLATTYLYSEKNVAEQEIVGVVSVDTFVDTEFYLKLVELEQLVHQTNAQLGLIGIKPTYPSSKYGYLIAKEMDSYIKVSDFTEKPSEQDAEQLINRGAYWNSGIFLFRTSLILHKLEQLNLPKNFKLLSQQFNTLKQNSFDIEVVEELESIVALTYDGYWKDLGTWNTLTEEMSQQVIGNGGLSEDSTNTHIINELDLPVKVLGISNAVVAVSADGILVSDKPSSSRMKDMLHQGLYSRPMYEELSWGWYRVLELTKTTEHEVLTKRIGIRAHHYLPYQYCNMHNKVWTILSGEAYLIQDEKVTKIMSGMVVNIPARSHHGIYTIVDTDIVEVRMGQDISESDTLEIDIDWNYYLEPLGVLH